MSTEGWGEGGDGLAGSFAAAAHEMALAGEEFGRVAIFSS